MTSQRTFMRRQAFNERVEMFLSGKAQLPHKDMLELARFYSDRKILTRIYCSSCGFEGTPDEEEKLSNGEPADRCPECKAGGHMCSYTELEWRRKCKEWGTDYIALST